MTAATIVEPLREIVQTITGSKPDAQTRLAAAMRDVERLVDALGAIKRVIVARTDISRFDDYVKECSERFRQEKTFEAEKELMLARVIREKAAADVQPQVFAKMRYGIGGEESALTELFHHQRHWRKTLRAACEIKLEIAEADAKEVEQKVRAEWQGEGFSEKQIQEHPRLARANRQVTIWRSARESCDNDRNDIGVWKRITRNLNAGAMA